MLTKEDGIIFRGIHEIKQEDVEFYQKLQGQNTRQIVVAQPEVFKTGLRLNKIQGNTGRIGDSKALGEDGFNAYFFKKAGGGFT
ncbi:hypothetical protein H5410_061816, partial [Solanum commersonii]